MTSGSNDLPTAIPLRADCGIAVASGLLAGFCTTPIILTIDKAVVQAAAGQMKLFAALRHGTMSFLRSPLAMFKTVPLWLVWGVYGATYVTANLIDVYNRR